MNRLSAEGTVLWVAASTENVEIVQILLPLRRGANFGVIIL
jgi:hypothetical protein